MYISSCYSFDCTRYLNNSVNFHQICNFMTGDATALGGIDCDVSKLNLCCRLLYTL